MTYHRNDRVVKMLDYDEIKIGDKAYLDHLITQDDVNQFAALTGDFNPLHVDPEFSKQTLFQKPVVHGMLSASFISTMIGMIIPGGGALWMSSNIEFIRPAYVGDTLKVSAEVTQKSDATRILVLKVVISNQHKEELIRGECKIKMLELKKKEEGIMNTNKPKTVLITGGSGGIGAATAKKLAEDGHAVIINYIGAEDKAQELVKLINAAGGRAVALKADISSAKEVAAMFDSAEKSFGRISAIVHCAAPANVPQPFDLLDWESFQKQMDIHLKGAFNCVKRALPKMIEEKAGEIVFLGTIYTDGTPPPQQARYIVAKSALTSLARCLAVEYGPVGIKVNVVAPGMTQTEMIADLPDKVKMLTKMQTPLRRLADPSDIANAIAFLLSPGAGHITGISLRVSGGSMMM